MGALKCFEILGYMGEPQSQEESGVRVNDVARSQEEYIILLADVVNVDNVDLSGNASVISADATMEQVEIIDLADDPVVSPPFLPENIQMWSNLDRGILLNGHNSDIMMHGAYNRHLVTYFLSNHVLHLIFELGIVI